MSDDPKANIFTRGGVFYGRLQIAGRDHKRSLRTRDRAEALRRLKAWRADAKRVAHGGGRTWEDAAFRWLEEVAPRNHRPTTVKRYRVSLKQVHPELKTLYLEQIDRRVLSRVASRETSNATRRRDLTAVSAVLRAAVEWGWLDSNPVDRYGRRHIPERREPVVLPDDRDLARLIAAVRPRLGVLLLTLRHAGLRLEEAGGLTWDRVDLDRGSITLVRTKGRRPRVVPLAVSLAGSLSGVPAYGGKASIRYVFWHDAGERYHNLSSYLLRMGRDLDPPIPFRIHDLRHKFAVEYLRAGGGIYALQRVLGHVTIRTTETYLDYLTPQEASKAREG